MYKRKQSAQIDEIDDEFSAEQAKDRLKIEENNWKNLIEFGKEIREKELLDYHPCELENELQKDKKKRKKIINNIIKNQNRLHTLHYLTRHAGKGMNGCLKKLIITDENGTLRILLNREIIE